MIESAHHQWQIDTRADLEILNHNEQAVSEQLDAFAWRLKQAGHLSRREFDRVDRNTLIDVLTNDANQQVFCLRSRCRDVVELLLLLSTAPAADKEALDKWKSELSLRRIQFSKILSRNPSMRRFSAGHPQLRMGASAACTPPCSSTAGHYIPGDVRQEVLMAESVAGDWINRLPHSLPLEPHSDPRLRRRQPPRCADRSALAAVR